MKTIKKNKSIIEFVLISIMILIIYGINSKYFGLKIPTIIACIFMTLNCLRFLKKEYYDILIHNFIKFRYFIYLIIFIICVLLKIHGSSIGVYNQVFTEKIDNKESKLYGEIRNVRSDEYLVLTPYYISQTYNKFNKYSKYMSLDGQNMIISYNAPVYDVTTLCKPLNWGYILLGKEYGLSWYWCMKQILLFAFAFEMIYILTRKSNSISILGAFLVAFGPSTLWWYAPHMPDVILWSMGVLSLGYYLFASDKRWLKNLLILILPLVVSEFVIAIFPSFQVGLGIFVFVMFILLMIRDKINPFSNKKQIIRLITVVILTLSLLAYFIYTNMDGLLLSLNTVYPGNRISLGGEFTLIDLFTDLTTIFLPYKGEIPYSNLSEVSTYIHFGFFFLMLSPIVIYKQYKQKDKNYLIGIGFVAIILFYATFMIFGFPKWLAKITLFSFINRMKMIEGLILVFFTIWGIDSLLKIKEKINPLYYFLCVFIYCLIYILNINSNQLSYMPKYIYLLEILYFAVILASLYIRYEELSLALLLGLLIFASISINPIERGIFAIENHPSAREIKRIIKEDSDSYWIGYNSLVLQGYALANGAKTLNAVNYYPDFKKWYKLDINKANEEAYNRYAHIVVTLSETNETIFEKETSADVVRVKIPLNKFKDLNVKYILTQEKLTQETKQYKLEEIYKDSNCFIYEIKEKKLKKSKIKKND